MHYLSRCVSLVSLFCLIGIFSAVYSQDRNSITGFVFGEDRAPIGRLNIELQNDSYATMARTQTNGSGLFSFRALPAGQYVVRVLTSGTEFEEQSRSISLIPVSIVAGRGAISEQVDFYLRVKRRPGPSGRPEVVFAQEVPARAKEFYEAGVADLDKGKEADGYSKLKQALENFPDYFMALERLGNEYLVKGHFTAAHVLFTRAVSVNARSIPSSLGLGVAELRLGRIERSIEVFNGVIKLDKENVNAHYWRGIALHSSKKLGDAVSSLQRAEKLSAGKFPEVHWQLARVYKDQNKFRESADSLETYLKLKPTADNAEEIRRIIKLLREKPAQGTQFSSVSYI